MGEERHTAYVANETKAEKTTSCLPESVAVLTSTIPPSLQTPPIPSIEPLVVLTPLIPTTTEQRANDVVSRNKKTSASERLPEDSATEMLPIPPSAHQTQSTPATPVQAMSLCQPQDKASLPGAEMPR